MNSAPRRFSTLLAVALAGLAGACTTTPSSAWHDSDSDKRSQVALVHLTHDVAFESGSARLSPAGRADFLQFLKDSGVSYSDEVSIDTGGATGALAGQRRAALAAMLRAQGIATVPGSAPFGAAPKADGARVVVGRYMVTPPECPDWRQPSDRNYANTATSNYGCATQTNLGAMVANPHDLIEGRGYGGPDAEVAAKAVEAYHAGSVQEATAPSASQGGQQ